MFCLSLLGLPVTNDQMHLAVSGLGNLMGTLSGVANLLNNDPLNLTAINNLLSQINQILAGLGL